MACCNWHGRCQFGSQPGTYTPLLRQAKVVGLDVLHGSMMCLWPVSFGLVGLELNAETLVRSS